MFGKIVRTILKVIGWLTIILFLLCLAACFGEGIKREDIGYLTFLFVVGAGILLLVRRAEKKAELEEPREVIAANRSPERISSVLSNAGSTGSVEMRQVICDGCGASVKAGPGITECEYCGSHLTQV
ncbi:MAG: hypothetical protein ACM3PE_09265 [Deltaproteobacteria bacterium]